jgi:hypothetical protein
MKFEYQTRRSLVRGVTVVRRLFRIPEQVIPVAKDTKSYRLLASFLLTEIAIRTQSAKHICTLLLNMQPCYMFRSLDVAVVRLY